MAPASTPMAGPGSAANLALVTSVNFKEKIVFNVNSGQFRVLCTRSRYFFYCIASGFKKVLVTGLRFSADIGDDLHQTEKPSLLNVSCPHGQRTNSSVLSANLRICIIETAHARKNISQLRR